MCEDIARPIDGPYRNCEGLLESPLNFFLRPAIPIKLQTRSMAIGGSGIDTVFPISAIFSKYGYGQSPLPESIGRAPNVSHDVRTGPPHFGSPNTKAKSALGYSSPARKAQSNIKVVPPVTSS